MKERSSIGQNVSGRHTFPCAMSDPLEGRAILDAACGFGWFERYALSRGCERIVAIELDPVLVERTRREAPGAEVLLRDASGDLCDLGTFDLICAFDFLEHLPPGTEVGFLRALRDMLRPGGRLLLSMPNRSPLSNLLDPAYYFGHRHYDRDALAALLERSGFSARRFAFGGGIWEQLSLIWLYFFKWAFAREMPFASFLERKRSAEYRARPAKGSGGAYVTLFVEAEPREDS